jgi:hypothetical protein
MRIEVSQFDIDTTDRLSPFIDTPRDPVTKAIEARVDGGSTGMYPVRCALSDRAGTLTPRDMVSRPFASFDLPLRVLARVIAWDRGKTIQPFGFDIKLGME